MKRVESYHRLMNVATTGSHWMYCSNLGSQIQRDENSVTVRAADEDDEHVQITESFTPFP
jgi:hypothetical protein